MGCLSKKYIYREETKVFVAIFTLFDIIWVEKVEAAAR